MPRPRRHHEARHGAGDIGVNTLARMPGYDRLLTDVRSLLESARLCYPNPPNRQSLIGELPSGAHMPMGPLEGLPNKIVASRYRTALPQERLITSELERTRRALDGRRAARPVPKGG